MGSMLLRALSFSARETEISQPFSAGNRTGTDLVRSVMAQLFIPISWPYRRPGGWLCRMDLSFCRTTIGALSREPYIRRSQTCLKRELGTAWSNHANVQEGSSLAEWNLGQRWRLDLSAPLDTLLFPGLDEAVATRLESRDLPVEVLPSFPEPFGNAVERLNIQEGWFAMYHMRWSQCS